MKDEWNRRRIQSENNGKEELVDSNFEEEGWTEEPGVGKFAEARGCIVGVMIGVKGRAVARL